MKKSVRLKQPRLQISFENNMYMGAFLFKKLGSKQNNRTEHERVHGAHILPVCSPQSPRRTCVSVCTEKTSRKSLSQGVAWSSSSGKDGFAGTMQINCRGRP